MVLKNAEGDRTGREAHPERLTWSIPEAAKILGVSRNLAYEAARRGELATIRIGRRYLVPKAALLRKLENAGGQPLDAL